MTASYKAVIFDVCDPCVTYFLCPDISQDRRRCFEKPLYRNRSVRESTRLAPELSELFDVSYQYLCYRHRSSTVYHRAGRGSQGAWQRFERGEIPFDGFYDAFSHDLSDVANGNEWQVLNIVKSHTEVICVGTRHIVSKNQFVSDSDISWPISSRRSLPAFTNMSQCRWPRSQPFIQMYLCIS